MLLLVAPMALGVAARASVAAFVRPLPAGSRARIRLGIRLGLRRGRRSGGVRGDAPVRDVGRRLRATLGAAAADVAIEPVHVGRRPIARDEGHAIQQGPSGQHRLQLRAGAHRLLHLRRALSDRGNDLELPVGHLELLREGEGLVPVDGVTTAARELPRRHLHLRLAPLVARPIGVAIVVARAGVVRDLLHGVVALVHVELRAATQAIEALAVAIVVIVLARLRHGHVHEVEVHVAAAANVLQLHVHGEGLAWEDGLVELRRVAVVRRGLLHQVEAEGRCELHRLAVVLDRGAGEVVRLQHAVLLDEELALLVGVERAALVAEEGRAAGSA
mmetsp:Transcript_27653/g.78478  ORF Transcript_27653/g.78478 Transcript_27653/m.78478 type:complete len:331 (+) Transcript_27653:201-1193(+)